MEWDLAVEERAYLRELARKQADYAALPVMAQRKKMWYDLNEGRTGARAPVVIETWTFDRDFMPAAVFKCQSEAGRRIERQLLRNLRNHELMNDDKVMPDYFSMGWHLEIDELGVKIESEWVPDSQGVNTGFQYHHPIKDLARDLELLKPAVCRVDRAKTRARQEFLGELFDGILDVQIDTGTFGCAMLTQRVVQLMGMSVMTDMMSKLKLTVNEAKTHVCRLPPAAERFVERDQILGDIPLALGERFSGGKEAPLGAEDV